MLVCTCASYQEENTALWLCNESVNWASSWGDAVGGAGLLGTCQKGDPCNEAHIHTKTVGINRKPILCFLVIGSWGTVNLIKQKCEDTLKWIFQWFLSWLEATVTGIGHFAALSHRGHSCSSPLPNPCQLCPVHIGKFEVALTTITNIRSFPFHKNPKLPHASWCCHPSAGHLLATFPQGYPCPGVSPPPWATQSVQKCLLPRVRLQPTQQSPPGASYLKG